MYRVQALLQEILNVIIDYDDGKLHGYEINLFNRCHQIGMNFSTFTLA
jgi:hypothetical protein